MTTLFYSFMRLNNRREISQLRAKSQKNIEFSEDYHAQVSSFGDLVRCLFQYHCIWVVSVDLRSAESSCFSAECTSLLCRKFRTRQASPQQTFMLVYMGSECRQKICSAYPHVRSRLESGANSHLVICMMWPWLNLQCSPS